MEDRFPELTVTISALARLTPGNDRAPAYPFSGFVINLNSYTKVHRDGLDLGGCLVMAIGKFAGGELCLYEPGLVILLRSGDFVIFPSHQITHFNRPYTGQRASLVCHTDRHAVDWEKDRNGWQGSFYLDDELKWEKWPGGNIQPTEEELAVFRNSKSAN